MIKAFFNTLSYIFHPLFLPVIGLFFLFSMPSLSPGLIEKSLFNNTVEVKKAIYLIFTTLVVLAPGLSILIMYFSKVITSLQLENKKERTYVLGLMLLYTLFCYGFFRFNILSNPNYALSNLLPYTLGISIVILLCFIANFFIKISLHAAGYFGLVGAIIGYFNTQINFNLPFIITLVIVGGLVCAGRLYLKAHSNSEILLGILTGFLTEFLCMKFEWFV